MRRIKDRYLEQTRQIICRALAGHQVRIYLFGSRARGEPVASSDCDIGRECHKVGLLSEDETVLGLQMVDDRNLTSHTYHEGLAISIYSRLEDYARLMQNWLQAIEDHIGPGEEEAE